MRKALSVIVWLGVGLAGCATQTLNINQDGGADLNGVDGNIINNDAGDSGNGGSGDGFVNDLNGADLTAVIPTDLKPEDLNGADFEAEPVFSTTATPLTAGANPLFLAQGDFDGDGKTDLVVANNGATTVSVFLTNSPSQGLSTGNARFPTAVTLTVGGEPAGAVAIDLNRDTNHNLDLAVAHTNGVSVLFGGGNGTFGVAAEYAAGTVPSGIGAADLDSANGVDLVVANLGDSTVTVLPNNGSGVFSLNAGTFSVQPSTAAMDTYLPAALLLLDVTGDGKPDVLTPNLGSNNVSLLVNNTGTNGISFAGATTLDPGGMSPNQVIAAVLTSSGRRDLIVVNSGNSGTGANVAVLLSTSTSTFAPAVPITVGTQPSAAVTGDFDGDGKVDIVVANTHEDNVGFLKGKGDGTFVTPEVIYPTVAGGSPVSIIAGFYNSDTKLDVAVANNLSDNVSLLFNIEP